MTKIFIRPATRADEDALAALAVSSGLFAVDEAPMFRETALSSLRRGEGASAWLIAEDGRRAVIGGALVAPDGLSEDVRNLLFLAVDPDARRLGAGGAGGALLAEAERLARGAGARLLLIETSSAPEQAAARALYGARGYRRQGRIEDYYAPGEDKVIFVRALAAPAQVAD